MTTTSLKRPGRTIKTALDTQFAARTLLTDEQWPAVFEDPVLQQLVTEALKNNLDLCVAAQRVLEAQGQAGIVRSQQYPTINGGASYTALQIPSSLAGNNSNGNSAIQGISTVGGPHLAACWGVYIAAPQAPSTWDHRPLRTVPAPDFQSGGAGF
jgi:outer membrane protein TolC